MPIITVSGHDLTKKLNPGLPSLCSEFLDWSCVKESYKYGNHKREQFLVTTSTYFPITPML